MPKEELAKGLVGITIFGAILAGLTLITKLGGKDIDAIGSMLLKISGAMLILTVVAKILASMEWSELGKAAIGMLGLSGIVAILVMITKLAGDKSLDKLGSVLLAISASMLILTVVAKILASMEWSEFGKAAVGLLGLTAVVAALVSITKLAGGNDLTKVAATLLAMSVSIGILAGVVALLGLLEVKQITKGLVAVGILSAMIRLLITATKDAKSSVGNLAVITVAVVALSVAVAALSLIEPAKLAASTAAIATLIGMFTLLIKASGSANGSVGTLVAMTVAVGVLGGLLYLLARLPVESTIGAAASLSVLLVAVAAAVSLLSKINISVGNALKGVLALTLMAVPILAFVGVLAVMQNVQNATANVNALVVLTTALTLMLIPLAIIGTVIASAALGVASLLLMAVPLVAFVGILALMDNLQNATANVDLITKLMTTMTGMLVILAVVGPLALIGVGAMASLTALIVAFGLLAIGVGALMDKFPELEAFMDKGLGVLQGLARGLGSLVGEFISGFTETLPGIGEDLSNFMDKLSPFIAGASSINSSVLSGIGYLSAAIIAITVADVVNGLASFLSGGSSLTQLGIELSSFMMHAMPFILGVSMLKENTVAGVKSLTDMILTLTKANIIEGLTSWFTGGSSLESFGEQLIPFGEAMVEFSNTVTGIDESAVTAAANAGKIMAEMASSLPNSGGVVGFFAGENDMSTFASQLVPFGRAIALFSTTVSGKIDETAVESAANAGKTMIAMADTIPNSGGVVGFFAGENDIETFGTQLVIFGRSIVKFSKIVSGNINQDAVEAAAMAGATMVELANTIPNTGGLVAWFAGDNDMGTFGTQLATFGESIVSFSGSVAGIDPASISSAVLAVKAIIKMAESLPESGGFASIFTADNDLSSFGKEMASFGKYIKNFSDVIAGADLSNASSMAERIKSLVDIAKDVSGTDFGGIGDFAKSMKDLGKVSLDKFIGSFKGADKDMSSAMKSLINTALKAVKDSYNEFRDSGKTAIDKFAKGLNGSKAKLNDDVTSMISKLVNNIRNKYSSFKNAGKYLVDGFADGISANTYKASAKAKAMAAAAANAARKELDEHSPSKVGYAIGDFFGLGFVNAIGDYADKAYKTSSEMASKARNGLSDTIGKISDFVTSDMDVQPTIRPVLDLSDVRAGSKQIGGLLDANSSVGVLSNVRAVSSMMNSRQNGINDDVVSAIDRLRGDIGSISGNSYTINGITYSEGSEVSEAIETLVRSIKVGRRA